MSCNNRCNSSLACGISNAIVKKLIAENCGEGGVDVPDDSGCVATFANAVQPFIDENSFSVTYSFNGGPQISYFDEDFYYVIDRMTLHPTAIGEAIFILNPNNLPSSGPPQGLSTLAGFTHDGFMAGDLSKRNILNEREVYFDKNYNAPFSFSPEVNTLEIYPTMDVRDIDMYNFFGGASLGGEPIVIKSCSTLILGKSEIPGPMPGPMPEIV